MKHVSVVIVNYNAGSFLLECVRRVLASESVAVDVYLSDNASTDTSLNQLKRSTLIRDPRLHLIENTENLGFAKGNNVTLSCIKSDFILFLNPDCYIETDTIYSMLTTMEHYPEAGMAGCLIQNFDGTEQVGCRRYIPTPWRSFVQILKLDQLFKNDPRFFNFNMNKEPLPFGPVAVEAISGAFMLVRRTALEAVGPLDEGYFMHCEDLDWCLRFTQKEFKILFVPNVVIQHAKGISSQTRPLRVEYYKHKGMVRFYLKFFKKEYSFAFLLLIFCAIWSLFLIKAVKISAKKILKWLHLST